MRFRWANSISTRLRPARLLESLGLGTTSRASSWMLRGILRAGFFGQHRILNGQTSQSSLFALYSSCSTYADFSVFSIFQWARLGSPKEVVAQDSAKAAGPIR